ncbi:protein exordium [Phtheirospermum japonicum]|uniref:Protein exordium n=1 Tax=Phtheirospermum japonicum TaxID=374723 RepID=A0A830C104_9LAMI|nr:protein exordium [Phtheirospermum japonicum]
MAPFSAAKSPSTSSGTANSRRRRGPSSPISSPPSRRRRRRLLGAATRPSPRGGRPSRNTTILPETGTLTPCRFIWGNKSSTRDTPPENHSPRNRSSSWPPRATSKTPSTSF